ncbi:MAG TPA: hypothetical protein VHJ82_04905, partial [Actinomycetota bacterium]|nr:hypothetical protein [Actinomycetota bacterium]
MAKRAIIFVHGIGEQQRYLMRDGLANAIVAADIGATRGEIVPIPIPVEGAGPHKNVVGRMVTRGVQRADIFEVYWAPRLSGKTKTPSVLRWILGATFLPATALRRPSGKTLMDILQVLLYSVIGLFAALMTLNVLGNLTAFADCATRPEKIQEAEETKECDPQIAADSYISVPDESRNLGTASATLVRQVRRALALSDRPLSDLTPEHAGEVL